MVNPGLLTCIANFGTEIAPFGACSSLARIFKMLSPLEWNGNQVELDLLSRTGEIVVFLHWLSIPGHFDSPLLCHLPSLAGAQRGVLQTLSSHSGIPSLVTPNNTESFLAFIQPMLSRTLYHTEKFRLLFQCVRYVTSHDLDLVEVGPIIVHFVPMNLISPFPTRVSVALEFNQRFVRVASDAVRMEFVKQDLLDRIVFAVSCSSFLDDYEKGVAVIGILLDTIRRDDQKRRMSIDDGDVAQFEVKEDTRQMNGKM
ncbi:hypothetical protein BLNAU_8730 [Blattamonas nauphoetae]|uniref:Uncharacterized protein n=1 Tax=Blattamonas nauphoetae TaxID=2049346 RepID=A0ABQ9XY13_9EUKA|nr:hypothetical protein BLNAU_8730 [Blattamonas nauphoetae]